MVFVPEARRYPIAEAFFSALASKKEALARPTSVEARAVRLRPGVVRGSRTQTLASEQLETLADAALLRVDPSGEMTWEISLDDDLLGPLACHISIANRRVSACFYSQTEKTFRLLEAQKGRLYELLEGRGLKIGEVLILFQHPDKPL